MKNQQSIFVSSNTVKYLLLLVLTCAFSSFQVASIISIIAFFMFVIKCTVRHPQIVLKYIFFFFAITTNILGCAVCEFSNVYIAEMEVYAHYVGSLPLLILSRTIFIILIVGYEKKKKKTDLRQNEAPAKLNDKVLAVITALLTILYAIVFIKVLPYPAFRLSLDRFSYTNAGVLSNLWKTIVNYSHYLVIIPIVCFTYTKRRLIPIASIIFYLLFNIWMGNKFGTIFNVFSLFYLVYFSRKEIAMERLRVALFIGYGAIAVLAVFASILQVQLGTALFNSRDYLFSRIAQQGELWWRTIDLCKFDAHPIQFIDEIPALFRSNAAADSIGASNGIYRIMYLCTSKARVDNSLFHGARYTEAGYAASYYYFSAFGCVLFSILMFILVVRITNKIVEFAKKDNILGLFIEARFFMIVCSSLSMFTFSDLFSVASILSYIVLFLLNKRFLIKKRSHRKIRVLEK